MSKLSNLLEKDLKIVEKRKFIFLIPVCFVILAIIMGVVFHFTSGSALNLGMDFAGGYTINVDVGANLSTDADVERYKGTVTDIVESYGDYGIKVSQILTTGTGDNRALQVRFKSLPNLTDDDMEVIVEGIKEAINDVVTVIKPKHTHEGSKVTLTYTMPIESLKPDLEAKFANISGASGLKFEGKTATFNYSFGSMSEEEIANKLDELATSMSINDRFSASVYDNGKVGATVSKDLLYNAISAILIALVLMLIYIAIRFEFKSGISAIVALIHDLIVMFAFMIIFHVEFNSTFIAALITILGYSINNAIILFDRVRSNLKLNLNLDTYALANTSIKQSFVRCMNTTITTVIMIGMVALVCALVTAFSPELDLSQMVTFSLPIIVGLISGLFSSMFIAPSVWVSLGGHAKKTPKAKQVPVEANE